MRVKAMAISHIQLMKLKKDNISFPFDKKKSIQPNWMKLEVEKMVINL